MLRRVLVVGVLLGCALAASSAGSLDAQSFSAQSTAPSASPAQMKAPLSATVSHKADIPAYHTEAPKGTLPETLDPKQFLDVETRNVYTLAGKEKDFLYQQPCYCRCDKEVGHKSLLDCFTDYHGAHCILCKKEAVYTYTESQQGKTAAQIRQEIMDGKWKEVDLTKYDDPLPAK